MVRLVFHSDRLVEKAKDGFKYGKKDGDGERLV